ncbi:MAG: hypothetical protein JWQ16_1742 [Novosphingobium sp.]|nr:hypothetical protein [Novosphingobium sp.]
MASVPANVEISFENCPRERRNQAGNPVTCSPGALHPIGQPISMSEKRGLEVRAPKKDPFPLLKLTRTGSEDGDVAIAAFHPIDLKASQSFVQLRVV